jgi:hypothetical protein
LRKGENRATAKRDDRKEVRAARQRRYSDTKVLPDWKRRRQESAVCESVSSSGRTVSLLLRALNSRRTTYLLRGKIADAFAAGIVKLSPMQWKS